MLIRTATKKDSELLWQLRTNAILALPTSCYQTVDIETWANKPMFEGFKQVIEDNYYLVIEKDNLIIGGGFLDLKNHSIEAMYVLPSFQGQGIGKNILLKLLDYAKKINLSEVSLSSTLNAVPFYQSVGFVKIKTSKYQFTDGRELDCVDMKINL